MLRLIGHMDASQFATAGATVGREGDLSRAAAAAGLVFQCLGAAGPGRVAVPLRVIRLCRQFRPHVLYVFGMRAAFGGALIAARLTGARVIASQRNVHTNALWYWLQRAIMTLGGVRVITNSAAGAEVLRERSHLNADAVDVIYNGIDVPAITACAVAEPDTPPSGPGPHLVCVANLVGHKGHEILLEATRTLAGDYPDVRLHLVGRDELDGRLHAASRACSVLRDRVVFHGYLENPTALMSKCDIVVQASRKEGMPTALLEALACGMPVVATDVGGTAELIVNGVTGRLVPYGDPTALARAVGELLADRALAARLATAGKTRVEGEFSMDNMVRRHQDVFHAVRSAS